MSHNSATTHANVFRGAAIRPMNWLRFIQIVLSVKKTRTALAELTDDQLVDIGLAREEAEAESMRRAWDVPAHWRRA